MYAEHCTFGLYREFSVSIISLFEKNKMEVYKIEIMTVMEDASYHL